MFRQAVILEKPTSPNCDLVLQRLRDACIKSAISLPLLHGDFPFSVVKIFIPQLENPDGLRKRRYGSGAAGRILEMA